jgi:Ca2+-binding EF-hand superfamily protein
VVIWIDTALKWIYTDVIQPVINFFNKIKDWFVNVITTAKQWINENIIEPLKDNFDPNKDGKVSPEEFWNGIKNYASKIKSWVNTNIIQPIKDFFTNIKTWFTNLEAKVEEWINENIIEPLKKNFDPDSNGKITFSEFWGGIKNYATDIATWFNKKFVSPIKEFFAKIQTWFTGIINTANQWIEDNITKPLKDNFDFDKNGTISFSDIWNKIGEFTSGVADWVGGIFTSISDYFNDLGSKIANALETGLTWIEENFDGTLLGEGASWLKGMIDKLKPATKSTITNTNNQNPVW